MTFRKGALIPPNKIIISPNYHAFMPCGQASPDTVCYDRSPNVNDATLGAATTSAGVFDTNLGWVTFVYSSADEGMRIPLITWDMLNGQSLLFSFTTAGMVKTTQRSIFSTISVAGIGKGWVYRINTTGQVQFLVADGTTNVGTGNIGADITTDEYHHVVAIDGVAKTSNVFQNGVVIAENIDISTVALSTQPENAIAVAVDVNPIQSAGGQYKNIHVATIDGALPSNIGEIVTRLYEREWEPLSASEFTL